MLRRALLPVLLFLLLAPPPRAIGGALEDSKLALHLTARNAKSGTQCDAWDVPCSQFATAGETGVPYDMYLVVANGDPETGISGLSCGIEYDYSRHDEISVLSWSFCGALEFPSHEWPASRSGIRLTWNATEDCQNQTVPGHEQEGVHAVAGAFYVYAYSDGQFSITPHTDLASGDEMVVTSCIGTEAPLPENAVGSVHFTTDASSWGTNPCPGAVQVPPPPPPSPPPPPPPPPPPGPSPGPSAEQEAAFMLHVAEAMDSRVVCERAPLLVTEIVTKAEASREGSPYYVYVLGTPPVTRGLENQGLLGLRFGIRYDTHSPNRPALNVISWNACNNPQIPRPDWPQSYSGNTLLWSSCETGQVVVGGYFYLTVYAPSVMALAEFPTTGEAQYADCDGGEEEYKKVKQTRVGWVSMGGGSIGSDSDGCNPALEPCFSTTPVHRTTWGGLKTKYEN